MVYQSDTTKEDTDLSWRNKMKHSTGTKHSTMYKQRDLKCAKCGEYVYITNLDHRLYCKKCREYKD